jgi:hypothetical protein
MPPVRCVPTATAKRALLEKGFQLVAEDEWNMAFVRDDRKYPLILPKECPFVPMDIMQPLSHLLLIEPTAEEIEEANAIERTMDVDD